MQENATNKQSLLNATSLHSLVAVPSTRKMHPFYFMNHSFQYVYHNKRDKCKQYARLGKKDQNYESLVPNSHSQALVLELELERNCLLQFP